MKIDPFAKAFKALNPKAKDEVFTKPKVAAGGGNLGGMGGIGGGGRGGKTNPTRKPEPVADPADFNNEPLEVIPATPEKPKPSIILRNPKWEVEKVGFNEETDISVEIELPEDRAHKTRMGFKLFAKTPGGPESIVSGEGHAKEGKATCRIPVYIPKFKDAAGNSLQKVEYYFTAKHSDSELLDGFKVTKTVDGMAERLIESHILPDLTFAFDKSFLHPKHAAALKDMCVNIKAWREKNPDGKLAVFGHADAVGKEDYNKALSERRAKSVFGFLMKDAGAWSELDQEEKWGLVCIQDLLKHLGHDPGASDGQDGPKTQAAVKEFQTKKGLAADGQAGAVTRKAMYQAFMDEGNDLSLKAKDFDDINGGPTAGCSEFNLVEKTEGVCAANRRVAVLLLKSNKKFPIHYPCAKGNVAPCKSQVAKKGERRTAGFGCFFYDKLVVERKNNGSEFEQAKTELEWKADTFGPFLAENGIIPHSKWGRRQPNFNGLYPDSNFNTVVLHHSGNDGAKDPLKIETMHIDKEGWADVGYHFMIDPRGKVYEGRSLAYKGTHVKDGNTGRIGILIMGDFEQNWWDFDDDGPTPEQIVSLMRLISALKKQFPTITFLGGHKDYQANKECPGNAFYQLMPSIRKKAALGGP